VINKKLKSVECSHQHSHKLQIKFKRNKINYKNSFKKF